MSRAFPLSLVLLLLTAACAGSQTTPAPTTTPATTTPATTTPATTTSGTTDSTGGWFQHLGELEVDDGETPVPYDRGDWGSGWIDADGDCRDTRQEVLVEESTTPAIMEDGGCRVAVGRWYGAYTDAWFDDPGNLDIDHFVPLANAHASGGWAWDAVTKRAYANDLDDPRHLIAVSASANRSKGKKGPEDWVPDHQPYHCEYAYIWTSIKARWKLTVTNVEHVKLTSLLATCDGTSPTPATPPVPPSTTAPTASTPTTSTTTSTTASPTGGDIPANPGNSRNCSDFADYDEAKAWFDTYFPHYGDVARLDNDGDGEPCESLPGGP
ncbi:MAG: excalibur calcium-binding domain-containing protein [Acidimicrobiales bacterium]|nr:excalibur calcium-binding domain-containing protein [Acidimicrobiales bacterium]